MNSISGLFAVAVVAVALGCTAASTPSAPATDAATDALAQISDTNSPADASSAASADASADVHAETISTDASAIAADSGPSLPTPVWSLLNPLPQQLWGSMLMPAPTLAGIYVGFGGNGYPQTGVNQLTWQYTVATDSWTSTTLASAPPPRYCHCMVTLPTVNEVLLVGGRSETTGLPAAAWT
ncbi:MAG: hypothetical protein EXR77_16390 [Myxococcales bacterium]|nr:hypothetical protein [Myxococcales bacterium]